MKIPVLIRFDNREAEVHFVPKGFWGWTSKSNKRNSYLSERFSDWKDCEKMV